LSNPWLTFWAVTLVFTGAVFAVITVIVAVKGGAELIRMFRAPVRRK